MNRHSVVRLLAVPLLVLVAVPILSGFNQPTSQARTLGNTVSIGIGVWFYNWYPTVTPDHNFEQDAQNAHNLGSQIVRVSFRWDMVEPEKGHFRWDVMDYIINTVVKVDNPKEIIVLLTNTASWAVPQSAGKDYWRTPIKDVQGYQVYLTSIVNRYKDRVKYWEIWNEPNLNEYWLGTVQDYVNLLKISFQAIKSADPSSHVLNGGTDGADYDYVKSLYALGAGKYFDILALHPYSNPDDPRSAGDHSSHFFPSISEVLNVMSQNRDSNKTVWLTELAWAVDSSYWGGVTPAQQAEYMNASYDMVLQKWPQVKAYIWYSSRDQADGNWGLLNQDQSKRPSWNTFESLASTEASAFRPTPPSHEHVCQARDLSTRDEYLASEFRTTDP